MAHSDKIALQVEEGMLHASNLSRNVAKRRGLFYFSCNSQRNNCSCKMGGVTREFFLATCNATFVVKSQFNFKKKSGFIEKFPSLVLSRGPFLEGPETFPHPESRSKISDLLVTELRYLHILNVKRL